MLTVTVAGHRASQAPHSDGWIVWRVSPPIGKFAPCHTFIRKDTGSDDTRIQDITEAIQRAILAGDDRAIEAAHNLMTTFGWA